MPSDLRQRSGRDTPAAPRTAPKRRTRVFALAEARWAAAALVLFLIALPLQLTGAPAWAWGPLYAAAYVAGGWEPAWAGLAALQEKALDVDLLMIVAAIGAASIGQVMDGALLIVIFATSGALEALATARTRDAVRGLLDLAPTVADRLADDGSEATVPTEDLVVGDTILVRPGERVGADGRILSGVSEVDQATITGEPLPVAKEAGDEVFAGTLNGTGALRVKVERDASDSVIARIVAMVEEASDQGAHPALHREGRAALQPGHGLRDPGGVPGPPRVRRRPDRLAAAGDDLHDRGLAVRGGSGDDAAAAVGDRQRRASRRAGEVRRGDGASRTGRRGRTRQDRHPHRGHPPRHRHPPRGRLWADGRHPAGAGGRRRAPQRTPLARAVVDAAHTRNLAIADMREFTSAPGFGVTAVVGGHSVAVGAPARLLDGNETIGAARAAEVAADLEDGGRTAVLVLRDSVPVGVLGIADRLRPDATATVAALTTLTGSTPVLATGDNPRASARLAAEVGITGDEVHAGLLPEDKVEAVRRLAARGRKVLVLGDGVNDAPALAAAHTGIAMGRAGSDLARESADAVIVRDELATVPTVIALSRAARRLVVQNLVIAAVFISGLVVWDLVGRLPLPLGVLGHEGSTVIVGLNGLRLLREAAWNRAAKDMR